MLYYVCIEVDFRGAPISFFVSLLMSKNIPSPHKNPHAVYWAVESRGGGGNVCILYVRSNASLKLIWSVLWVLKNTRRLRGHIQHTQS